MTDQERQRLNNLRIVFEGRAKDAYKAATETLEKRKYDMFLGASTAWNSAAREIERLLDQG